MLVARVAKIPVMKYKAVCRRSGMTPKEAIGEAVRLAGGQSALAAALGKRQAHVYHWLQAGRVPAQYCPSIERITSGAVTCEDLWPDTEWSVLRISARVTHHP
jgi:DNA-binding transcriptional regulator YdaS (Cro superfamily)